MVIPCTESGDDIQGHLLAQETYRSIGEQGVGSPWMQASDFINAATTIVNGTLVMPKAIRTTRPKAVIVFAESDTLGNRDGIARSVYNQSYRDWSFAKVERKQRSIATNILSCFMR